MCFLITGPRAAGGVLSEQRQFPLRISSLCISPPERHPELSRTLAGFLFYHHLLSKPFEVVGFFTYLARMDRDDDDYLGI